MNYFVKRFLTLNAKEIINNFRNYKEYSYNKFNELIIKNSFNNKIYSLNISKLLIGTLITLLFITKNNSKTQCIENTQKLKNLQSNKQQVQILILNKPQLINQLTQIQQQSILIAFNKYFKNQKNKEFQEKLQKIYEQAKLLNITKIYLIDKNHIKQLISFEKILNQNQNHKEQAGIKEEQNRRKSKQEEKDVQYDAKSKQLQYYYLTPNFKNKSFKLDSQQKQITPQINQIRKFSIKINPSKDENNKEFYYSNKIFNQTTVIKQCPEYIPNINQNKCIQQFKNKISTLIQQKMLRNKQDQFRFYVLMPNSKKDISPLMQFKRELINKKQQATKMKDFIVKLNEELSQKQEDIYILKNDMLGQYITSLKYYKKQNYQLIKKFTQYEKFIMLIRPRIFIISQSNFSVDLYWFITCMHKNRQPTISLNNTAQFNLGYKYPITNGKTYPLNTHLQFLKILYKNHPQLNYVIINTNTISELIRHLFIKNKYVIFNLNNEILYPKIFLPNINHNLSLQQNYNQNFKTKINEFKLNPQKYYDKIIMQKQMKIDRKRLQQLVNTKNTKDNEFILRVCSLKCQQDISQEKLNQAYHKLFEKQSQFNYNSKSQNIKRPQNWRNQIYRKTYWIDSYFHNIGLKDQNYIFTNNNFQTL